MLGKISLLSLSLLTPLSYTTNTINTSISTNLAAPQAEQDPYGFIYDRTFSLIGGDRMGWIGTGWLFSKCDIGTNDNGFYMFTNWHVSDVMKSEVAYRYSNDSDGTPDFGTDVSNNMYFFDNIHTPPSWNNANYNDKTSSEYIYGVDASILEVDFGDVSDNPSLASRLNKLNEYAAQYNGMLFPGVANYDEVTTSTNYYSAGYPGATWDPEIKPYLPKWQGGTDVINMKNSNWGNMNESHAINDSRTIISISNNYLSPQRDLNDPTGPLFQMGGGASGSMMIDEHKNLLGLYWGGYTYTNNTYRCAYETFAWGDHNLFNDFKAGKWNGNNIDEFKKDEYTVIIIVVVASVVSVCVTASIIVKVRKNAKKRK